jgi:hypothetical protein
VKRSIQRSILRTCAGLFCAALGLAGAAVGCAGANTAQTGAKTESTLSPAQRLVVTEAAEQVDAQRAWCTYLEALYLRASPGVTAWPKFEECTQVTTTAAPKMLRRTADCSRLALERFAGDPFTAEYAAEVSQCGSTALEAMAVSDAELAPYVAILCQRVVACGHVELEQCRDSLQAGLGEHLGRAVGAINTAGKGQLRACLSAVSCDDLGPQITACLTPLMDKLLWLPG